MTGATVRARQHERSAIGGQAEAAGDVEMITQVFSWHPLCGPPPGECQLAQYLWLTMSCSSPHPHAT